MYRFTIFTLNKSFIHQGCFYIIILFTVKFIYCNIVLYSLFLFNFINIIKCWEKKESDETSYRVEASVSWNMLGSPFLPFSLVGFNCGYTFLVIQQLQGCWWGIHGNFSSYFAITATPYKAAQGVKVYYGSWLQTDSKADSSSSTGPGREHQTPSVTVVGRK